jgi:hydrogenase expression/formation protein HypE
MGDAAVLQIKGRIAFSTDTFVVKPIFFNGGDIGILSICGTANDLLMMGGRTQISCSWIYSRRRS